ncbi:uncharacterized protein [Primulina huaijiensis]|uniref:uncharacterized protein n=1 Tax=Primulina huaijiensis TaxID=1492673 RepID=UPI003CC793FC
MVGVSPRLHRPPAAANHHHIILSPLTAKPTSKMPLATSHRSLDIITCKDTEVSQQSSLASASSGEYGKNWVPVVLRSALPKDDVIAIENRSPAEGAYSEGLLNAKLTQDGSIVCPTTDSTFDLRIGEIKDWYPKNPVLRVLTPPLRTLFVYPAKSNGGTKSDASTEIVRMVFDEDLEGFGFTGKNELINGRAAIIGFLVLLDFELLTGNGLLKGTGFLDFIYSISNTLN